MSRCPILFYIVLYCSISKPGDPERTGATNLSQILDFPYKNLGEGLAKISEWIFQAQPRIQPVIL